MPTKARASNKMPPRSRRNPIWPITLYRTPDGQLHDICNACRGTGKRWIETTASDSQGTTECRKTHIDCLLCRGTGFDSSKVEVIEHDGKYPPRRFG